MKNHLSKLPMILIGFIGGIAFLISCGSDDSSSANAADPVAKDYYLVDVAEVKAGRLINIVNGNITTIMTEAGYIVDVLSSGELHTPINYLFYESNDCTGQAYAIEDQFDGVILASAGKTIYVPVGASEILGFLFNSTETIGTVTTCNSLSGSANVIPAYLNDSSITGVPDAGFTGRMRIKVL